MPLKEKNGSVNKNPLDRCGICYIAIALFMAVYLSFFPFSVVHQDFARDMFIGLRLSNGIAVPMQGPILASTVHMGPAWYYLLGLLFKLCANWMFVTFCIALLGALQFPLAYLLGRALGGRFVGLAWASFLLIPSWSSFEQVFPLHYQLTATLVLALLFQAYKFQTTAGVRHAFAMMLFLSLALHAHPTTVCFALVVVPLLIGALWAKRIRATEFFAAFAIAAVLFVPYVITQYHQGFADFHAAATYLSNKDQTGSLVNLWPLLTSVAARGTSYWLTEFVALNATLATIAVVLLVATQAVGWATFLLRLCDPIWRPLLLCILFTVAVTCVVTTLIRSGTTFYMTTSLHVVLCGVAAFGLGLLGSAIRRWLAVPLVLLSLSLAIFSSFSFAQMQTRGTLPVAFIPVFNVIETGAPPARMPLLPANGVANVGRFLCADRAPSIHGALARQLLYDYAMAMRLQCGRADVVVGGDDANREHWAGFSRAAFSALKLAPQVDLGPIGVVRAFPLGNLQGVEVAKTPIYPSWMPASGTEQARVISAALPTGATRIAVSNRAFFVPNPKVRINGADEVAQPIYQDDFTTIFQIESSQADVTVEISIVSSDLSDVDVVAF